MVHPIEEKALQPRWSCSVAHLPGIIEVAGGRGDGIGHCVLDHSNTCCMCSNLIAAECVWIPSMPSFFLTAYNVSRTSDEFAGLPVAMLFSSSHLQAPQYWSSESLGCSYICFWISI